MEKFLISLNYSCLFGQQSLMHIACLKLNKWFVKDIYQLISFFEYYCFETFKKIICKGF